MAGLNYTYSNDTAASDPTAGKLKFNDADLSAITKFRISLTDAGAADRTATVRQWDNGANPEHRGYIMVRKPTVPSDFVLFEVTDVRVDNSGWEEFTVAFVQKGGSISNGDSVEVLRAGASTIQGSVTGRSAGLLYTYSSDTANTDPTSGKLKFDNADPTLASELRISDTDGDGNPLSALLAMLSASTTTANRATIVLYRESVPGTILVLSVTGARTDNSGWKSFPVTVLSSNGAFNNLDSLRLLFSLTGDQGGGGGGGGGVGGADLAHDWDLGADNADSNPGSGKLKLDNDTPSSASKLFISVHDNNRQANLDLSYWGSSSAVNKTLITLIDAADPTNWISFYITDGTTNAVGTFHAGSPFGYVTFPITVQDSSVSTNLKGKSIIVHFDLLGDPLN